MQVPDELSATYAESRLLEEADDTGAAAELWDRLLLGEPPAPREPLPPLACYAALLHRVSLPLPLPLSVIDAAHRRVHGREDQLTVPQEADFRLLVATAMYDIGLATFAERLRAYESAVQATRVWQGSGLMPGRSIDQLGFLVAAYTDIGADEGAALILDEARSLAGLAQVADCSSDVASVAARHLVEGSDEPVIDLGARSREPAEPVGAETVGWLRQLEAEVAASRGDIDTAVCLYQALACLYRREGPAFAISAADAMTRGPRSAEACRLIEKALAAGVDQALQSAAVLVAAKAHLAAGDHGLATSRYDGARILLEGWPNIVLEPDLEVVAARLARARGDSDEATACYLRAVTLALERRAGALGPALDDCAMRAVVEVADEAVEHCLDVADHWTLAWITDVVKSARLASLIDMRGRHPVSDRPLPDTAGEQAEALRNLRRREIAAARARIENLNRLIAGESDDTRRAELVVRRDATRRNREELIGDAVLEDGLWRALAAAPPALGPESFPDDRTPVLSLYCRAHEVLSTLIVGGTCRTGRLAMSDATAGALRMYVENLASPAIEPTWRDPSALGLTMQSFVPDELVDELVAAQEVVIVPHRDLHLLPWGMLRVGEHRLIERVDVAAAPNLTSLQAFPLLRSEAPRLGTFAPTTGIRDRQLATDREVAVVRSTAGEMAVAEVGGATADGAALLSLLVRPDVDALHIASHGWASAEDPLGAGVVSDDGVVAQIDLFGVDSVLREVYVSACLAGWRPSHLESTRRMSADEGHGLLAAFTACGASAIVASVTLVDDEPSIAMATHYYRFRYEGMTAFRAWCSAARQMLSTGVPPSSWCGYVYFGGVREV